MKDILYFLTLTISFSCTILGADSLVDQNAMVSRGFDDDLRIKTWLFEQLAEKASLDLSNDGDLEKLKDFNSLSIGLNNTHFLATECNLEAEKSLGLAGQENELRALPLANDLGENLAQQKKMLQSLQQDVESLDLAESGHERVRKLLNDLTSTGERLHPGLESFFRKIVPDYTSFASDVAHSTLCEKLAFERAFLEWVSKKLRKEREEILSRLSKRFPQVEAAMSRAKHLSFSSVAQGIRLVHNARFIRATTLDRAGGTEGLCGWNATLFSARQVKLDLSDREIMQLYKGEEYPLIFGQSDRNKICCPTASELIRRFNGNKYWGPGSFPTEVAKFNGSRLETTDHFQDILAQIKDAATSLKPVMVLVADSYQYSYGHYVTIIGYLEDGDEFIVANVGDHSFVSLISSQKLESFMDMRSHKVASLLMKDGIFEIQILATSLLGPLSCMAYIKDKITGSNDYETITQALAEIITIDHEKSGLAPFSALFFD